jgi:hypothetical protein
VPAPGTSDGGALAAAAAAAANSKKSVAQRHVGDLVTGWRSMVVCGLLLPFLLSLLWMVLLRFLAGPLVWGTLATVDIGLLAVTLYCFSKAGVIGTNDLGAVKDSVTFHNGRPSFNFTNVTAAFNASVAAVQALNNASATAVNVTSSPAGLIVDIAHDAKLQMYYLGVAAIIATLIAWITTAIFIPRIKARRHAPGFAFSRAGAF